MLQTNVTNKSIYVPYLSAMSFVWATKIGLQPATLLEEFRYAQHNSFGLL